MPRSLALQKPRRRKCKFTINTTASRAFVSVAYWIADSRSPLNDSIVSSVIVMRTVEQSVKRPTQLPFKSRWTRRLTVAIVLQPSRIHWHTSKPGPEPDSDSKKTGTKRKPGLGLVKNPDSSLRKAGLAIRSKSRTQNWQKPDPKLDSELQSLVLGCNIICYRIDCNIFRKG